MIMKTSIKILIGIVVLSFMGVLATRVGLEAYAKNNPINKNKDSKLIHKMLPPAATELLVEGDIRVSIDYEKRIKKAPTLH